MSTSGPTWSASSSATRRTGSSRRLTTRDSLRSASTRAQAPAPCRWRRRGGASGRYRLAQAEGSLGRAGSPARLDPLQLALDDATEPLDVVVPLALGLEGQLGERVHRPLAP